MGIHIEDVLLWAVAQRATVTCSGAVVEFNNDDPNQFSTEWRILESVAFLDGPLKNVDL